MNSKVISYIGLFVAVLAVFASCQSDHHQKSHQGHHTGVLEVSNPIKKDTSYYNPYVSQIQAFQHIELKSMENGYLERILVDEGELVEKGQLLFQIQPTVYKAEVKKAEAEMQKAMVEYQNTRALADSNVVSSNELSLARAHLDNAEAELDLKKAHLKFTEIRAPFNGIIGRFEDIRLGSLIEEGEKLTTLTDNSKMWVYFNVPESAYLDYAQHQRGSVDSLQLQLANGQVFNKKGTITAIEAQFDNTTGTIAFRASFANPDRLLRQGQTGNILWPVAIHEALLIPQKATFEILEKRYVYVVDKKGEVHSREIEIASELDHLYVVKEGLNPEDKFLLEGLRKVQNGDKIEFEFKKPEVVFANLELHAE
ncbi:membrane fusion protein (multidrug efflux system) [Salegentibacter sp. 24]|uniref:efflux RND transporter periplasmic adaptor subunit n=1 Tax=Salegentibacter sp. 24 TaxID=2183986 RepID=UPI0010619FB0|nr:efflux RND transporter periplasmic adaptor subunit [Salegentibacter sp. 24]TDN94976.1 membrane fusion protein (multidrug efflux system) [Salegentibacter sp. 24]